MTSSRPLALRAILWIAAVAAAVAFAVFAAGPIHGAIVPAGADWPFARTFRYLLLLSLLAVVFVGLKPWRDAPADFYGLRGPEARPLLALYGVALSISLLLAVVLGQAAAGWITWEHGDTAKKFWGRLLPTLGGAVGIGVLEEVFFRGWLFGRLRRGRGAWEAAAWTALIFALPHAFQGSAVPRTLPASPSGAMGAFSAWGRYVLDCGEFGPKFVGLICLSLLLTASFLRTKTLWPAIGIHGGAHVFMQQYSALTDRAPERNWAGSKWLYDGVPAWVLMALLAWALWPRARRGVKAPGP